MKIHVLLSLFTILTGFVSAPLVTAAEVAVTERGELGDVPGATAFEKIGQFYAQGQAAPLEAFDPERMLQGESVWVNEPNNPKPSNLVSVEVGDELLGTSRFVELFYGGDSVGNQALIQNSITLYTPLKLDDSRGALVTKYEGKNDVCAYVSSWRQVTLPSGRRFVICQVTGEDV